jgi:hypothetical protein
MGKYIKFSIRVTPYEVLISMVKRISIGSIADVNPLSKQHKYELNLFGLTRKATEEMNSGVIEVEETRID